MVVMVVEDSSTMRQLICHALRRIDGIVLVEASDGNDALKKLTEITPDLLLTDINMPNMDGFALIRAVRDRPGLQKLPIIVLTTAGATQDLDKAKTLEVTGYVTKPVKPDAIISAVRGALGKPA
jgi:two-component system, chemotaxis family, chemotaxis protein CheY